MNGAPGAAQNGRPMTRKRRPPPGDGTRDTAPGGRGPRAFTLDDYLDHLIAESNLRDALEGRLRGGSRRLPDDAGPSDDPAANGED